MKKLQPIICIDDSIPSNIDIEVFKKEFPNWVKKDEKYHIREIFYNDGIVTSLVVEELRNPILFFSATINRSQEASFKIERFRELEVNEEALELVQQTELTNNE